MRGALGRGLLEIIFENVRVPGCAAVQPGKAGEPYAITVKTTATVETSGSSPWKQQIEFARRTLALG